MATNYTCINKNRDNKGKIQTYVLQDDQGNVFEVTGQQIKANMNLKHFNITNLKLDKAGRLVDKVDRHTKGLEMAYQMLLQGKDIGFGCIEYQGKAWDLMSDKRIKKALKEDGITEIPIKVADKFEKYVIQKGIPNVYCLHIKSKDGKVNMKNYCLNGCEILMRGFISSYAKGSEYYLRPENYVVEAYILGSSNQPVRNIYIAPDFSTVKVLKGAVLNMEDTKMTRREFLGCMGNQIKNYFK